VPFVKRPFEYKRKKNNEGDCLNITIEKACQIAAIHETLEFRDNYTSEHSKNVANLMYDLSDYMGLSANTQNIAFVAGLVHDIGKMGISPAILNKVGKLTLEEYTYMQKHPNFGAEILTKIGGFDYILLEIRHHHERYDGTGYPDRLQGEDIPFLSRMLAVCDTYDAMTTKRCYSPEISVITALAEIEKCTGSQFDAQVSQPFLKMMRKNRYCNIPNEYKAVAFNRQIVKMYPESHIIGTV
jgi:putative nucleotidyltransferase with HDIG domain